MATDTESDYLPAFSREELGMATGKGLISHGINKALSFTADSRSWHSLYTGMHVSTI